MSWAQMAPAAQREKQSVPEQPAAHSSSKWCLFMRFRWHGEDLDNHKKSDILIGLSDFSRQGATSEEGL